jgi:hypothetical protein
MTRSLIYNMVAAFLLANSAVAGNLTIPFPPTISSSTDPASTSFTTIIENITCSSLGTNNFDPTSTVTDYTVVTVTTCPCVYLSTMVTLTQTASSSPTLPTTTSATTSVGGGGDGGSPPTGNIPYADPNDFSPYYPCVPGTFLCSDASTFWTCDITVSWSWAWQHPRQVADGMECIPALLPGIGDGQMPSAPAGYYRSDQYARARPLGGCSPDGSIECLGGGGHWAICDHGRWVDMGAVAPGTLCANGEFVPV